MPSPRKLAVVFTFILVSASHTAPAKADLITFSKEALQNADAVVARWLGPSRPMAHPETPEDRIAAAIRLLTGGGIRDHLHKSGSYHTHPGDTRMHVDAAARLLSSGNVRRSFHDSGTYHTHPGVTASRVTEALSLR